MPMFKILHLLIHTVSCQDCVARVRVCVPMCVFCVQLSEEDEKSRCKLSHHEIDCPSVGKIDVFVQASTHIHSTHFLAVLPINVPQKLL